jgi:putative ABC transport system substrate-binding protein
MTICLRRREFIAALGGAAAWPLTVAWPLAAGAQQPTRPTIGWLDRPSGLPRDVFEGFRRGLAENGLLEGRDVTVEYPTDGHPERLPGLAADLVRQRVAVIVASTTESALAAKAATRTIPVPVVFFIGADPVEVGLVASLNHPGGNLTGVVILAAEIAAKRLELLHKLVPATESIAMLAGPADRYTQAETRNVQSAARTLGLRLLLFNVTTESEVAAAFATLVERQAGAVLLSAHALLQPMIDQIISRGAQYALPTMFFMGSAVREGGLLSYGPVFSESYRVTGAYAGRILKGEKPADLPVQLPTRFEFVINLKTAKALRLEIAPLLLALADEVIE